MVIFKFLKIYFKYFYFWSTEFNLCYIFASDYIILRPDLVFLYLEIFLTLYKLDNNYKIYCSLGKEFTLMNIELMFLKIINIIFLLIKL